MTFRITPLTAADADRYNALVIAATKRHSDTLRMCEEDVVSVPFSTTQTSEAVTLVALDDNGEWLGVGSLEREQGRLKRRHVAWVVRMIVTAQGAGIGRAILRALKQHATTLPGVTKVNLTVASHNERAVQLYTSEGFVEFARETDGFYDGERAVTEVSMSWPLA